MDPEPFYCMLVGNEALTSHRDERAHIRSRNAPFGDDYWPIQTFAFVLGFVPICAKSVKRASAATKAPTA